MSFSFSRSFRNVGIDFGATSIKVVELEYGRDGILVTGMGKVATPRKETEGQSFKKAMKDALQTLISHAHIKSRKVVSSLPTSMVNVRHVRMHNLSKEELRDVLPIEAEGHLGEKVEDTVIDFSVVGEVMEKGQRKKEVILIWVNKEDVQQYIAWLKDAGLTAQNLEFSVWSSLRSIERLRLSDKAVLVVNLGGDSTTLGILHKHEVYFARKISWGSEEWTRLIQKKLKLDWKEADRLKTEYGFSWNNPQGKALNADMPFKDMRSPAEIAFEVLRPQVNSLQQEIQSSIGYFSTLTQGRLVEEIILLGGGSLLKGISSYLTGVLNIPVRHGNPFNGSASQGDGDSARLKFNLKTGGIPEGAESLESAEWAVAFGAALRGYNAGN
jgi:type IV pilus assembly protein PilM